MQAWDAMRLADMNMSVADLRDAMTGIVQTVADNYGAAAAESVLQTGAESLGLSTALVLTLSIMLQNVPEGMVVGLAAALALRGEPDAISGALALALGIGLQNIPEGAAVSLPLAQAGQGRRKAFCAGAASGLVEPLGALLALALAVDGVKDEGRLARAGHAGKDDQAVLGDGQADVLQVVQPGALDDDRF